jgi:hypothetical protein
MLNMLLRIRNYIVISGFVFAAFAIHAGEFAQ